MSKCRCSCDDVAAEVDGAFNTTRGPLFRQGVCERKSSWMGSTKHRHQFLGSLRAEASVAHVDQAHVLSESTHLVRGHAASATGEKTWTHLSVSGVRRAREPWRNLAQRAQQPARHPARSQPGGVYWNSSVPQCTQMTRCWFFCPKTVRATFVMERTRDLENTANISKRRRKKATVSAPRSLSTGGLTAVAVWWGVRRDLRPHPSDSQSDALLIKLRTQDSGRGRTCDRWLNRPLLYH